jgi:hypothetical protein
MFVLKLSVIQKIFVIVCAKLLNLNSNLPGLLILDQVV